MGAVTAEERLTRAIRHAAAITEASIPLAERRREMLSVMVAGMTVPELRRLLAARGPAPALAERRPALAARLLDLAAADAEGPVESEHEALLREEGAAALGLRAGTPEAREAFLAATARRMNFEIRAAR